MMLSIIMPCFKRSDLVRQGLESIKKQHISVKYEVLVINDGIPDDTEAVCKEFSDKMNVRYIFSGQRNQTKLIYRCPSFAINIGVKQAKGKILLLTSPEIYYLTPECLDIMVQLSIKNEWSLVIPEFGYDDQKGLATQRILAGDKINPELEPITELNIEYPFCLMLHKQRILEIRGYDEDFTGYCYDDADFIERLTTHGCGSYVRAIDQKIIHLFHGVRSFRDGLTDRSQKLNFNRNLYNERKGLSVRNLNRDWGLIDMGERKEEFTITYDKNRFRGRDSKSGKGSDLENVQNLIPKLANFIKANELKSLVDAPCGDFNWMPHLLKTVDIEVYRGYDIVDQMIEDNKNKYPGIHFETKDIVIDGQFGKADMMLCRDCLVHLSFESIKKVIQNFFYSDIKFFVTTHFTNENRINRSIADGIGWFPITLTKAPFFLPEPRLIINEGYTGDNEEYTDKSLAVWKKTDLINQVSFK